MTDPIVAGAEGGGKTSSAERNVEPSMYDLILRGGEIVDGSGRARFQGDVAIRAGRIAAVGDVTGLGDVEIDATGRVVTPGFVDIHTHYDGHVTWANQLRPSSQHGVTTVVMGNCGVGFAPCRPQDRRQLIELMEGVEDIPEAVMAAGLPWNWESYPQYLDRLSERAFDVDVAAHIPHAPLRVYVMGARALDRAPATPADIRQMRQLVREAICAGAIGFSTSRSLNHRSVAGEVTPSYAAATDELAGIALGLRDAGAGVLQMISDFDDLEAEFALARRMGEASGRPLSLSVLQMHHAPDRWREVLERIAAANAEGLEFRAQVCGRPVGIMLGLGLARHPFQACPGYRELSGLPLCERARELRRPERRSRVLAELSEGLEDPTYKMIARFDLMYEFGEPLDYTPQPGANLAARAAASGTDPAAFVYDLLASGEGEAVLYLPAANFAGNSTQAIEAMLAHPNAVLGLGDGGAHCGLLCDASLPTYMLQHWVGRRGRPVEQVVTALTAQTAAAVGMHDRGMIKPGLRADLNVIDMDRLRLLRPSIAHDLPCGGGELRQGVVGFDATIVAGRITYRQGVATGDLPGRLVRGRARLGETKIQGGHAK